jgi:hypothetical protein
MDGLDSSVLAADALLHWVDCALEVAGGSEGGAPLFRGKGAVFGRGISDPLGDVFEVTHFIAEDLSDLAVHEYDLLIAENSPRDADRHLVEGDFEGVGVLFGLVQDVAKHDSDQDPSNRKSECLI